GVVVERLPAVGPPRVRAGHIAGVVAGEVGPAAVGEPAGEVGPLLGQEPRGFQVPVPVLDIQLVVRDVDITAHDDVPPGGEEVGHPLLHRVEVGVFERHVVLVVGHARVHVHRGDRELAARGGGEVNLRPAAAGLLGFAGQPDPDGVDLLAGEDRDPGPALLRGGRVHDVPVLAHQAVHDVVVGAHLLHEHDVGVVVVDPGLHPAPVGRAHTIYIYRGNTQHTSIQSHLARMGEPAPSHVLDFAGAGFVPTPAPCTLVLVIDLNLSHAPVARTRMRLCASHPPPASSSSSRL